MANESPPPKPLPPIEEIQALLEQSAARTKKRLPLAFARPAEEAAQSRGGGAPQSAQKEEPAVEDRPTSTQQNKPSRALPVTGNKGK